MQELPVSNIEGGDITRHPHKRHGPLSVFPLGHGAGGDGDSCNTGSDGEAESSTTVSLLEEESFVSKLLTREASSMGFSSRIYYRAAGKVPFDWEIAPGRPKNPSETDKLPPLSPPPSVHHRHLVPRSRQQEKSRFWFLKASGRRSDGCLLSGITLGLGDSGGVHSSPDVREKDFPATEKEFRWPESARNGCLPFDLSSVFGSGRRGAINLEQ